MLEIQNLNFSYDKKPILKDVSFSIAKGDFCAIIGQNGSGKSTLLKAIAGLLKLTSNGSIWLCGRPIADFSTAELATQIAYVSQRATIVFDFSVYEVVMMGRYPYLSRWQHPTPTDRCIVTEILQKMGLSHLANKMLTQLSGGELQRVMIARALAQQTPLLLLDEPLANLDIVHRFDIMNILQQQCREQGTTILIVLHDFSFTKPFTSKTLIIKDGAVHSIGATAEIITETEIRKAFNLSEDYHLDIRGNVYQESL